MAVQIIRGRKIIISGAYDETAQAFFDENIALGGTLDTTTMNAFNDFVLFLKGNNALAFNYWTTQVDGVNVFTEYMPLIGGTDAEALLLKVRALTPATPAGGIDYGTNYIEGDGTGEIDLGMTTAQLYGNSTTNNKGGVGASLQTNIASGYNITGCGSGSVGQILQYYAGQMYFLLGELNNGSPYTTANSKGVWQGSRTAANNFYKLKDDITLPDGSVSFIGNENTHNLYLLCANYGGSKTGHINGGKVIDHLVTYGLSKEQAQELQVGRTAFHTALGREPV